MDSNSFKDQLNRKKDKTTENTTVTHETIALSTDGQSV
jgi:hypothetical protein